MSFLSKLFGKNEKLKKQLIMVLNQDAFDKIPTSIRYENKTYYITPHINTIELKADGEKSISIAKSDFMDIKAIIEEMIEFEREFLNESNVEDPDYEKLNTIKDNIVSLVKECNNIFHHKADDFESPEEMANYNFILGVISLNIALPELASGWFMCALKNGYKDPDHCQTLMAWCMMEDEYYHDAIENLQIVLTRDPDYKLAWKYLAGAYTGIEKIGKAGKCVLKVVSLEKDQTELYDVYFKLGDFLKQINMDEWGNHFIELSEKEEPNEKTPQILEDVTTYFEELASTEE